MDRVVRRDAVTEETFANLDSAPKPHIDDNARVGESVSEIKKAYGMPADIKASNDDTLQMVFCAIDHPKTTTSLHDLIRLETLAKSGHMETEQDPMPALQS